MNDTNSSHRRWLSILNIQKIEISIVPVIFLYIISYLLKNQLFFKISSFIFGVWLLIRSADWLGRGASGLSRALKLSEWITGIISSIVCIAAELVLTLYSAFIAAASQDYMLLDIAMLSLVFTMYINLLLVGILVVLYLRRDEAITVPIDVLVYEPELLTFAAYVILMVPIYTAIVGITKEIHENVVFFYPRYAGLIIAGMYLIYLVMRKKRKILATKDLDKSPLLPYVILTLLGVASLLLGGEVIMSTLHEILISFATKLTNPIVVLALVLALIETLHDMILSTSFMERGHKLEGVSNLVNSTIQIALLVMGIVAFLSPIPIRITVDFAISCVGVFMLLMFFRLIIGDKKIDKYEGTTLSMFAIFALVFSLSLLLS